jgi:tetratricopeptide (TPR) repeat protein
MAASAGPSIETLGQLTRLQIPVTNGSSFRMLSGKGGELTLVLDRVTTAALDPLTSLSDSRVQKISVRAIGLDKAEVVVRFQEAGTESFAYQQGTNLVVDLWKGSNPAAAVAKAEVPAELPKRVKTAAAKPARAPAAVKKEATKPKAAQAEPLKIDRDLFQKFYFPMPELTLSATDKGLDLPLKFEIEDRWKFGQGDKDTDDGKGFEFAKSLFTQKKYGLCLKTIEIVLRDQPKTPHEPELILLRALAYRRLGDTNKAEFLGTRSEQMLVELAARRDDKGRPLPFQRLIVLSFAQKELAASNWLAAIEHLEYVVQNTRPKDPEFPYVQFLLAGCYAKVSQPRRAERLYSYVTEHFPKHILAKESAYRTADLLALEKNYQRVTEESRDALSAYPEFEKVRPEVLFEMGEAYFWLGNYAKAEKAFKRYTDVAPSQTTAGLAWVRLGEIDELHRSDTQAAREKYFRAKNGYPFSKGDLVASVRLARIDLANEKDPAFVVRTLREMLADKALDWDLRRMAELTLSDYLLLAGETESAIQITSAGMAQTDGSVYELYKRAYQKALFTRLSGLAKDKKYAEALALYEKEKKWLEQYGPETLRVASTIYGGLGLYSTANKMMERYTDELAKGRMPSSIAGQGQLRREKAANSFARGAYTETLENLDGSQDALSTYMKAMSHFRVSQKTQAFAAADRVLAMIPGAKEQFNDDMIENVVEILIDRDNGERDFERMGRDVAIGRALMSKDNERLAFAAADALWYQKRHKEAAEAYRQALGKHTTGIRAERGKYNLGMSLVSLGQRDEAVKLLTELRNSGQSVWAESAKQEIQLIEWEKKYSSVLRTLPPGGLGIAN